MYDFYPDSAPYSERGATGLGHYDGYQIDTPPATEQHPKYPPAYQNLASPALRGSEVSVEPVEQ